MNGGDFTNKAQEAIQRSQEIASEKHHQQIDVLHLLLALLEDQDGVVNSILKKIDKNPNQIRKKIEETLFALPRVFGQTSFGQAYLTQDFARVLDQAKRETRNMGDEFISVEHLFLGILAKRCFNTSITTSSGTSSPFST